jgi:hypothetical protein
MERAAMLGVDQHQHRRQHHGHAEDAAHEPFPHGRQERRAIAQRQEGGADKSRGEGDRHGQGRQQGQLAHGAHARRLAQETLGHDPHRERLEHVDAGVEQRPAHAVSDQQVDDHVKNDGYADQGDAPGRVEDHEAHGQQGVGRPEGGDAGRRSGQEVTEGEADDDGDRQAHEQGGLPALFLLGQLLPHARSRPPGSIRPRPFVVAV